MRNIQISLLLVVIISLVGYTVYAKLSERYDFRYKQDLAYQVYSANKKDPQNLSFAGERVPTEKKQIASRVEWELHLATYWRQGTAQIIQRANYWLPIFEKILVENDIPADFKYLAVIESTLTNVVSPAGATGFWQLMPDAARMAGLEVNGEVDERYDPIKATYAAIAYFKYSYGFFKNWTNVAASYNMGVGGMQYALQVRGTNSYYDLYLNAETARYVFKTVAFKHVYENLKDYDFENLGMHPYPAYRKVKVKENITNLANFAKEYGISLATLKEHNAWLRANTLTIKNGKHYEILIPVGEEGEQKAEEETLTSEIAVVQDSLQVN